MNFDQTKKTISDYAYFISQRIGNGYSSEVFRGINEKTSNNISIQKKMSQSRLLIKVNKRQVIKKWQMPK